VIVVSARARDVLARATATARRFDPDARIRIERDGEGIRSGFAHAPEPGDQVLEDGEVILFVEQGLAGTIDVTEHHDQLVLRAEDDG
jgi:hypothetical protein